MSGRYARISLSSPKGAGWMCTGHTCELLIAVLLGGGSVFVCLFVSAALCVWLHHAIICESVLMQTDSTESTELD